MTYLAIDPGMTGAVLIRQGLTYVPHKMPVLKLRTGKKGYRSELDLIQLAALLGDFRQTLNSVSSPPEINSLGNSPDDKSTNKPTSSSPKTRKAAPRAGGKAAADFATSHERTLISGVRALLERQSPHRGQGFYGNASIMRSYGVLEGLLTGLAIPYAVIEPQLWRREMRLGPTKERSWLLLARECPDLARSVGSWSAEYRIAVADCYCMLSTGERKRWLPSSVVEDDWLA